MNSDQTLGEKENSYSKNISKTTVPKSKSGVFDEESLGNNRSKISSCSQVLSKPLYMNPIPEFKSINTFRSCSHNIIFNKEIRFPKLRLRSTEAIYDPKNLKIPRAAGIGLGKKGENISRAESPSPDKYIIRSLFEENLFHKKGPKIAERFSDKKLKEKFPGPGQYKEHNYWIKKYPIAFSLNKITYFDDILRGKTNISPQRYNIKRTLVESQRYKGIGIGLGERSLSMKNLVPGVGSYNLPSCFDPKRKKVPLN